MIPGTGAGFLQVEHVAAACAPTGLGSADGGRCRARTEAQDVT